MMLFPAYITVRQMPQTQNTVPRLSSKYLHVLPSQKQPAHEENLLILPRQAFFSPTKQYFKIKTK